MEIGIKLVSLALFPGREAASFFLGGGAAFSNIYAASVVHFNLAMCHMGEGDRTLNGTKFDSFLSFFDPRRCIVRKLTLCHEDVSARAREKEAIRQGLFFLEARARKSRPRLSVPEGGFGSRCLDHHPPPFNSLFGVRSKIFLPPPRHGSSAFAPALFFQFLAFSSPPPPLSSFPFCLSQGPLHNQGTVGGAREGRVKRQKIEAMPPPPLQRKEEEEEERGCTVRENFCASCFCVCGFLSLVHG